MGDYRKLEFGSLEAFASAADKPHHRDWNNSDHHARSDKFHAYNGPKWHGNATFNDALNLVRTGWCEGRERIAGLLAEAAAIHAPRLTLGKAYDVAGAFPDVQRYVAGAPDCMVTPSAELRDVRPIVRVLANRGALCDVPAKYIENWGVALLAHVDRAETDGFSVELTIVNIAGAGDNLFEVDVLVKRAGEPLELDRLAFVLAHPAWLRRLHFALREQQERPWRQHLEGMGSSGDVPLDRLEPSVIYIPRIRGNDDAWRSLPAAMETMRQYFSGLAR